MIPTNGTTNPRRIYLLETLGDQIAPNSETWELFESPETPPQAQALRWLSEEDDFSSDPQSMSASILLERYVLAVVYFSTVGSEWLLDFPFLEESQSVCEWNNGGNAQGGANDNDGAHGVFCSGSGNSSELVGYLQLQKMGLSGTIPWEISLLEQLHTLTVGDNGLRGTIPPQLGSLSNLRKLRAEGNALTGHLPGKWGTHLEELDLGSNYLSGELPSALGNPSSQLKLMRLGFNNVQGTLPTEISNLSLLETLELSSNDIRGSIPSAIGRMEFLQDLLLEENALTGSLPSEIGGLSLLVKLTIWGNHGLSGTVPDEYNQLTSLETFSLEDTSITGSLDSIFCPLDEQGTTATTTTTYPPPKLYADCLGEAPEVECSCCYYCCARDDVECEYM